MTQNLSVSITASTTGYFQDLTHSDTIAAGDKWNWQITTGATGTSLTFKQVSVIFKANTNTYTQLMVLLAATYADNTTHFEVLNGTGNGTVTVEANVKNRILESASLKNGFANITANDVTLASTIQTRKNAANGTVAISVTGSTTGFFEDTSHTDSTTSGDDWDWTIVVPSVSGSHSITVRSVGLGYESTGGISLLMGCGGGTAAQNSSTFYAAGTILGSQTEANQQIHIDEALTWSNATLYITANGIAAGNFTTFKTRKNTADGNQSVSINGGATGVFTDSTHTDPLISGDLIDYDVLTPAVIGSITIQQVTGHLFRISEGEIMASVGQFNRYRQFIPYRNTTNEDNAIRRLKRQLIATGLPNAFSAALAETVTFLDSLTQRTPTTFRTLTENISFVDTLTRILNAFRSMSESVSFVDSISRAFSALRTMTENVSFVDSISRLLSAFRSVSENTSFVDTITRKLGALRSMSESVSFNDSIVRLLGVLRTLTETVTFNDTITRLLTSFRSMTENISFVDTITRKLSAFRTMVENTSFVDSIVRVFGSLRSLTENVSISDVISRLLHAFRTLEVPTTQIISYPFDATNAAIGGGSGFNESLGWRVQAGNSFIGSNIQKVQVKIGKFGSPTGHFYIRIRNSSNTIVSEIDCGDVSTLAADPTRNVIEYTFSVLHQIAQDDKILLEYTGGDTNNFLSASQSVAVTNPFPANFIGTKSGGGLVTWNDDSSNGLYLVTDSSPQLTTISFSDSISRTLASFRTMAENISFSDVVSAIKSGAGSFVRNISETLGITDLITAIATNFPQVNLGMGGYSINKPKSSVVPIRRDGFNTIGILVEQRGKKVSISSIISNILSYQTNNSLSTIGFLMNKSGALKTTISNKVKKSSFSHSLIKSKLIIKLPTIIKNTIVSGITAHSDKTKTTKIDSGKTSTSSQNTTNITKTRDVIGYIEDIDDIEETEEKDI